MTGIQIQVNVEDTWKALNKLEKSQWPYALAKTLTNVATMSAEAVRRNTKQEFDLRSEKFTLKGIRTRYAKKSDVKMGKGKSTIYTSEGINRYMVHHEKGARRGPIVAETIAVPAKGLKRKKYRTPSGRVKKMYQPKELMKQAGQKWMYKYERGKGLKGTKKHNRKVVPFTIKTKTGAIAIVRRITAKSRKLEYLWILKKVVQIKDRWQFEKHVRATVDLVFEKILKRNLNQAMKTRR